MATSGLILQWSSRRSEPHVLHGITCRDDHGSVRTACKDGWLIADTGETFRLDGAITAHRCDACSKVYLDQRFVERGLRELVENTFSHIADAASKFRTELGLFNPRAAAAFEQWLGPCPHGASPTAICAHGCARQGDPSQP